MPYSAMLRVEAEGPVLRLTLDRPDVRNAFNDELIALLSHAVDTAGPEVRVIVLSGEGAGFCAGGDLGWMRKAASYSQEENQRDALKLAHLFELIATSPAVVITKVHGVAFGGGCGLVAASDIALAAEGCRFSFSEVRLGLVPATISPFVIPKIGQGNARALFTTGEAFEASRALNIGLVHEVHPAADLDDVVEAKVAAVLACGPQAVATAKRIASATPMSLADAAELLAEVRSGDEAREGIAAFLDKRAASFVVKR